MPGFFTCRHCGHTFPHNPRLKKQRYCSSPICQNARKRFHDKKIGCTAKGKLLQKARNKRWRDKAPAHSYQTQYRKSHPEYEDRNREQQKLRNKRRQKDAGSMIVKTDALVLQTRRDGEYLLSRVKKNMIVNRNALSLQPSVDGV